MKLKLRYKGGKGSGFYGHAGRPGIGVGGSSSGGGLGGSGNIPSYLDLSAREKYIGNDPQRQWMRDAKTPEVQRQKRFLDHLRIEYSIDPNKIVFINTSGDIDKDSKNLESRAAKYVKDHPGTSFGNSTHHKDDLMSHGSTIQVHSHGENDILVMFAVVDNPIKITDKDWKHLFSEEYG